MPKTKHFIQQGIRALFVLLIIGFVISMMGCAQSLEPRVVTKEVKVEVPVRCNVELPEEPKRPFDESARKDMSLFDKSKLLLAQDEYSKAYQSVLRAAATSCITPVTK